MQITDLETWPLREPDGGRRYTVARLRTKSGITGYGECGAVPDGELARAREILPGREATSYELIWRETAALSSLRAALNMALLDIVGKAAKAPVYQVLGGPTRNKARALAPLDGASERSLLESLESARKAGFRAFLVPVPASAARNQGQAFVHAVARRLELLRQSAGDDADFVLDGAGALSPSDASVLAAGLEPFHLLWFDEPCDPGVRAMRKISEESVTPLGFGRTLSAAGQFQDLLRAGAVDVVRPSLTRHGISQIRRIAALAETYYTAVAAYHDGGPVGAAAALHLAASLPNFFIQQIPLPASGRDRRVRAEVTGTPVETVKDGFAALPTGPGLGIEVREEVLARYRERVA